MKNIVKFSIVFLVTTSSVAMADAVTGLIYTGNKISERQLLEAAHKISAKAISSATTQQNTAIANDINSGTSSVTPAAPAAGITFYQIIDVISASVPSWEPIASSQLSTVGDHGGAWIDVAVFQYGYGNPNSATLAGSLGNHYGRDLVCGPLSAPYFCSVGDTVTGFIDYFEFTGPQSGQYNSSSSSIAYPYGTWTDSLYIK